MGDFSNNAVVAPPDAVWAAACEEQPSTAAIEEDFTLDGKYLANHSLQSYLDCSSYFAALDGKSHLGKGWVFHPLPLLTAYGNGEGGGDYYGPNIEDIGVWAWDILSVETEAPEGYAEIEFEFYE